jgi:hypothetical protein
MSGPLSRLVARAGRPAVRRDLWSVPELELREEAPVAGPVAPEPQPVVTSPRITATEAALSLARRRTPSEPPAVQAPRAPAVSGPARPSPEPAPKVREPAPEAGPAVAAIQALPEPADVVIGRVPAVAGPTLQQTSAMAAPAAPAEDPQLFGPQSAATTAAPGWAALTRRDATARPPAGPASPAEAEPVLPGVAPAEALQSRGPAPAPAHTASPPLRPGAPPDGPGRSREPSAPQSAAPALPPQVVIERIEVVTPPAPAAAVDPFASLARRRAGASRHGGGGR